MRHKYTNRNVKIRRVAGGSELKAAGPERVASQLQVMKPLGGGSSSPSASPEQAVPPSRLNRMASKILDQRKNLRTHLKGLPPAQQGERKWYLGRMDGI